MKNKNLAWRPTKFDQEIVRKLQEAFKRDATTEEACSYAGISRETFYKRCKQNKQFSDKIEQAKLFPHMYAKTKFFEALNSKDINISFRAALEFLRRRNPERKDKAENTNFNTNKQELSDEDMEILNDMWSRLN